MKFPAARATFAFVCAYILWVGGTYGQAPMAKPEELGLLVPRGQPAIEITDRSVILANDGSASPVVAKVYVEIGDRYIVLLPDGSLSSVPIRETTPTDRPFEAASKDEIAEALLKRFKGFKTRSTRRYLCIYNTTDEFCESKTAILETMYPMLVSYFKRQKLNVDTPDTPLVVVMFRTKAEFLKYRQMPDSLLAYYNAVNNRVFLYQYSDTFKNAPLIAIKQSTSTIAHEGVHQILHNIGVQKRLSSWPLWISEGLAEYFAPTSTGSRSKWTGVGKPNSLRMRELFEHLRKSPQLGSGNLVQQLIAAERMNSADYATAWSLTHYLATKRKKELFAYLRELNEIAPLDESRDELVRFMQHFGSDFATIEREMIKHIRSLPYSDPVLNQPYFLITATSGTRKLATITSSLDYGKVQRDMIAKLGAAERTKTRFFPIRSFPNRHLAQQAMLQFTR